MASVEHPAFQVFAAYFSSTVGIWLILIPLCLIVKPFRSDLAMLSPRRRGNRPAMLLFGLTLGLLTNLAVAAAAMLSGSFQLEFVRLEPDWLLLLFLGVLVQSGAEELLCRMFLMSRLRQLFPKTPAVAILGNGLMFTALHLANNGINLPGMISLVATAVELSLVVYCFDSLWAAILAHTAWNFTQSIVLGLPNSGHVFSYSVYGLTDQGAAGFAYDPSFGLEGSAAACIVLVLCCVALFLLGRRKAAKA